MLWIIDSTVPRFLSVVIDIGAITLPPFVFSRLPPSDSTLVHEEIHGKQTAEVALLAWLALASTAATIGSVPLAVLAPLLAILFHLVVIYGGLWLLGVVVLSVRGISQKEVSIGPMEVIDGVGALAYALSPLEREAYDNQHDLGYLARRKPFAWVALIPGAWSI